MQIRSEGLSAVKQTFCSSDIAVCRVRLESLRVKSNEMKGTERFSVPLPTKMKNLKSTERLLPHLCLSAHLRRPGHVAALLAD